MDAIQAAERALSKKVWVRLERCLLCRPCVGDGMHQYNVTSHLVTLCVVAVAAVVRRALIATIRHGMDKDDHPKGVTAPVGICESRMVKMVEEEGQVRFMDPTKDPNYFV